jgi:long-chain acyl-CoA synthetase
MAERERPWLRSYPPDVPHTLAPYPERPVWWLLESAAQRFPDSPAVAFPVAPKARRLTFRQLKQEAERFAGAMASMGVGKGDRVGLLLPNSPQFVVAWYGLQRLGAVPVGNNPLYTQRELAHQLSDAGVEILVTLDLLYPLAGAVRNEVGLNDVIVTKIGDYLGFPINKLAPIKQKREARHEGRPWPPVPAEAEVIWFDGQGACLFSKRLEQGRFVWPSPADGRVSRTGPARSLPSAPRPPRSVPR